MADSTLPDVLSIEEADRLSGDAPNNNLPDVLSLEEADSLSGDGLPETLSIEQADELSADGSEVAAETDQPTPAPESTLKTIGREFATNIAPAAGGLAMALKGAKIGAMVPGPPVVKLAGAGVGALAAGIGGEKVVNWAQKKLMGEEAVAENEAKLAANREASPIASSIGALAGDVPVMFSGAGVGKAAAAVPRVANVVKAAAEAGKKATVAQKLGSKIPALASNVASFGALSGGAVAKDENATVGDVAGETVKGMTQGAILGMLPHAKTFLGKYAAKPMADAAALAISSAVYDKQFRGIPIDMKRIEEETQGSIPAFVLMSAVSGLMRHPSALRQAKYHEGSLRDYGVSPDLVGKMSTAERAAAHRAIVSDATADMLAGESERVRTAHAQVADRAKFAFGLGKDATPEQIRESRLRYVQDVSTRIAGDVPIKVYDTEADLLVDHPEVAKSKDYVAGKVTGQYIPEDGSIAIVLDRMNKPSDIVSTVLHEGGGHAALERALTPEKRKQMLSNLGGKFARERDELVRKYGVSAELSAEEALSYLREQSAANPSAYQRAVALVKKEMRKAFPSVKFSDSDIEVFFADAQKAIHGDGKSFRYRSGDMRDEAVRRDVEGATMPRVADERVRQAIDAEPQSLEEQASIAERDAALSDFQKQQADKAAADKARSEELASMSGFERQVEGEYERPMKDIESEQRDKAAKEALVKAGIVEPETVPETVTDNATVQESPMSNEVEQKPEVATPPVLAPKETVAPEVKAQESNEGQLTESVREETDRLTKDYFKSRGRRPADFNEFKNVSDAIEGFVVKRRNDAESSQTAPEAPTPLPAAETKPTASDAQAVVPERAIEARITKNPSWSELTILQKRIVNRAVENELDSIRQGQGSAGTKPISARSKEQYRARIVERFYGRDRWMLTDAERDAADGVTDKYTRPPKVTTSQENVVQKKEFVDANVEPTERDATFEENAVVSKLPSMNDIRREPTGWRYRDFDDGRLLISEDGKRAIFFQVKDIASGTELQRVKAKAQAYAMDNPYADKPAELQDDIVSRPIFGKNAQTTTITSKREPKVTTSQERVDDKAEIGQVGGDLNRSLEIEKVFGLDPASAAMFNIAIDRVDKNRSKWTTLAEGVQKEALRLGIPVNADVTKIGDLSIAKKIAERYLKMDTEKGTPSSESERQVPSVRTLSHEGRVTDGKPIMAGDVFRTSSGRVTTPFPTQKSERYASQWTIDNAVAEAKSRGDDWNASIFERTTIRKNGEMTPSDIASLNEYLYGQQPEVVRPATKPLVAPTPETVAAVQKEQKPFPNDLAQALIGVRLNVTGDANKPVRQKVIEFVTGKKSAASSVGINAMRDALVDYFGIDNKQTLRGIEDDIIRNLRVASSTVRSKSEVGKAFRNGETVTDAEKQAYPDVAQKMEAHGDKQTRNRIAGRTDEMLESRDIEFEKQSGTTQVATTVGSYRSALKKVKEIHPDARDVLDYGAGLGLGSDAMRDDGTVNVDTLEVNPERWKSKTPVTYTSSRSVNKQYDAVVNLNVLNVVPKSIRDDIVRHIGDVLKPNGVAMIGTRKWTGDIDLNKNFELSEEPKSMRVIKKDGKTFQKGFDGNELVDYLKETLGEWFEVRKQSGIGANGAVVRKMQNAPSDIRFRIEGRTPESDEPSTSNRVRALPMSRDGAAREFQAVAERAYDQGRSPRERADIERKALAKRSQDSTLSDMRLLSGDFNSDSPENVAEAKLALNEMSERAVTSGDAQSWTNGVQAAYQFFSKGTKLGQSLAMLRDYNDSPESRRAWMNRILMTPDDSARTKIASMKTEMERSEYYKEQAAQGKKLYEHLKKMTVPYQGRTVSLDYRQWTPEMLMDNSLVQQAFNEISTRKVGRLGRMVSEWYRNSVLSAPSTQVINVLGNTGHAALVLGPQRLAEIAIGKLVGAEGAPTAASTSVLFRALHGSVNKALANAREKFRTESPLDTSKLDTQAVYIPSANVEIFGKTLQLGGKQIRWPQRLMAAADEFYKTLFMDAFVLDHATRDYDRLMKQDPATFTEDARQAYLEASMDKNSKAYQKAENDVREILFQQEGNNVSNYLARMNSQPGLSGVLSSLVFPFVRTPVNIVTTGMRKSPFGALRLLYKGVSGQYRGGGENRDALAKDIAEQTVALATYATVYNLLAEDENDELGRPWITGTKTSERREGLRESEREDMPPMSVRIGDKWISYSRLEPFATMLSTMVDVMQAWKEHKSGRDGDIPMEMFNTVKNNVVDKTFLFNFGNLVRILTDQDEDRMMRFASGTVAGFVPNAVRSFVRAHDPYVRDLRNREQGGADWLKTSVQRLGQISWPSEANAPIPRIGISGEPVKKETGALYNYTVPFQVQSADKMTKVDAMLRRYNKTVPNEDRWMPPPPRMPKMTFGAQKDVVKLTDEEFKRFQEIRGRTASKRLAVMRFNYDNPTERDVTRVKQVYSDASDFAAARVRPDVMKRWREKVGGNG